jgi:hypothetical protein
MSAVRATAASTGNQSTRALASNSWVSNRFEKTVARMPPNNPAAAPRIRNSTEKMADTRRRVAPSVLRMATSLARRKRVAAIDDARIMTPARIAKAEMNRTTIAIWSTTC